MTRDDIIRMAREAGYGTSLADLHGTALERFANLVAAAEREACAKVCEALWSKCEPKDCAAAIRARGRNA